jgi:hypothetical protein
MMQPDREKSDMYDRLAGHDFERAYQKGFIRSIFGALRNKRSGLLSFNEIRKQLTIENQVDRGMQEILISQIIGSLSRYHDFDNTFLPKQTFTRGRWQHIDKLHLTGEVLPPVEVYQLGEFYFVIDGNHRVSVAREKGQKFIDAHVIELQLPFQVSRDAEWEDILLAQERDSFYDRTSIARLRPEADIQLTLPGQYGKLLEHIDVHKFFTGEYLGREVSYDEAVCSWFDYIYKPMIDVIAEKKIMELFPRRSESDLYLWTIEHLAFLKERYDQPVSFEEAAEDFTRIPRFLSDFLNRMFGWVARLIRKTGKKDS